MKNIAAIMFAQRARVGKVLGPICPPDFVVPEGPLGTLGILLPFSAALGLVYAFGKKKIIF